MSLFNTLYSLAAARTRQSLVFEKAVSLLMPSSQQVLTHGGVSHKLPHSLHFASNELQIEISPDFAGANFTFKMFYGK